MPGIVVNTSIRTGPSTSNQTPTATFFVVGRTKRGPDGVAKMVRSLSEYETVYGEYHPSGVVHQQVQTFFEEGGAQVYVSRVVGASATAGSLNVVGGTGTALTLEAVGAGPWAGDLTASVETLGTGFQLKLFLSGQLVYSTGEVANPLAAVTKINASPVAANYTTASIGTAGFAPFAETPFNVSGASADETSINDASYVAALSVFTEDLGPGSVAVPDDGSVLSRATLHAALLDHAAASNRIALLSFAENASVADAEQGAGALSALRNSEYGAAFYPWVRINNDDGLDLTLSPEGYVAAKRSVAHNEIGAWASYAGTISEASYVKGTVVAISKEVGNSLDEKRVNAIRLINNRPRVYGARSLSPNEDNYRFITTREMLNFVIYMSEQVLEDLLFSPIDGRSALFSQVEARLVNMLEPIRVAGGLFEAFDAEGQRIDYGYSVQVDDAINPVSQLASGLVKAKVGIRVSSTSDQIQVDVTKSNLTASVI